MKKFDLKKVKSLIWPCLLGSQFHLHKDRLKSKAQTLPLHRSKSSCSRFSCFTRELHLPKTFFGCGIHFFNKVLFLLRLIPTPLCSQDKFFWLVVHVLNQVQNKTAFIHYFYKAIMNDSLACDLFSKNYEPFASLLVTWESFAFWFIGVFLAGLVP